MENKQIAPTTKAKKIVGIVLNVIMYIFFAFCIFALVLSVSAKKDADGAVSIFGKQVRIVVSDSMAKCEQTDVSEYKIKDIPVKSMIFIDLVPENEQEAKEWYANLEVGDVLTFRYVYVRQETITHRITKITEKETGGYIIDLEGDNKASDSNTLTQQIDTSLADSPNYVIGKVTGQSYFLGVVITAVKSPVGIVCIVIIPAVIIAIFEIIRLINAITEGKRKKQEEENRRRDEELENMRRQLELLQQQQAQANVIQSTSQPNESEVPMSATNDAETQSVESVDSPTEEK